MSRAADFERLFGETYDAVYRYALRRVPADAVQDVVAETFLTAWRRFGDLRGEPLPWLLGIARRVSANHLRGSQRRAALVERLSSEPAAAGPAVDRGVLAALATLSDSDRDALMLVAWDGFDNRTAARIAGCSAATFAVRLHRARRRLQRALAQAPGSSIGLSNEVSVNS